MYEKKHFGMIITFIVIVMVTVFSAGCIDTKEVEKKPVSIIELVALNDGTAVSSSVYGNIFAMAGSSNEMDVYRFIYKKGDITLKQAKIPVVDTTIHLIAEDEVARIEVFTGRHDRNPENYLERRTLGNILTGMQLSQGHRYYYELYIPENAIVQKFIIDLN